MPRKGVLKTPRYNSGTKYNSGNKYNDPFTALVRVVTEKLSLTETLNLSRKWVKIISETLNLTEIIRSPVNWVKIINETLRITEQLSLRRDWIRTINLNLSWRDIPVKTQQKFRSVMDTWNITDLPGHVRGRFFALLDTLRLTEIAGHIRNRFFSVLDTLNWTEEISKLRKALVTVLGIAYTRVFLVADAIKKLLIPAIVNTRQKLYCRLGGGEVAMLLDIFRGNNKTFEVSIKDESGQNLDLTGATVYFMVKESVKDEDASAKISKSSAVAGQIVITNAIGGLCEIYLVPADTSSLPVKRYVYEVKVGLADGRKYTVAMDEFVIKHVVKRA